MRRTSGSTPVRTGRLLVLPLVLVTAFALGAAGSARSDSAVGYQLDMARSGSQPADGLTPPLKRAWTYQYSKPPSGAAHVSYPLIVGNRVFVTGSYPDLGYESTVTALDLATGKPIWGPLAIGGDGDWSGLVYDGGKVFTLADDGTVSAFDPAHGTILWHAQIGPTSAEPAAANGVLYLVADNGMWGLNESNGHTIWNNSFPYGARASAAVAGGLAYFSVGPQSADAVDPQGHVSWWHAPNGGGGRAVAVHEGRLYVRDSTGTKGSIVLDAATGEQVGTFSSTLAPAFLGGTGFFVNNGVLSAHDLDTGATLWSFDGEPQISVAPVVVGDVVYAASHGGEIFALDAATGDVLWMDNAGGNVRFADDLPGELTTSLAGMAAAEGYLLVPVDIGDGFESYSLVAYRTGSGARNAHPANDDFEHAQTISEPINSETYGSNVGATAEPGEPHPAGVAGGASVWYRWTAPSDGNVSLNIWHIAFEALVGVYTGSSVSDLTEVTSRDHTGQMSLPFRVHGGTTYFIEIDGKQGPSGRPATGDVDLDVGFGPDDHVYPPWNDDFANPLALGPLSTGIDFNNHYATKEPGEPNHAGNPGGQSVWFTWTPPSTGLVDIDTRGSWMDTLLAVYTGDSVAHLTKVAANDDFVPGHPLSKVTFRAVWGQTYHIAVDGKDGDWGSFQLNISAIGPTPVVSSFSPSRGPVGTKVTISGSSLADVTGVFFGDETADFTVLSANRVQATVPRWATTAPLTVCGVRDCVTTHSSFPVTPTVAGPETNGGRVGDVVGIAGMTLAGATSVTFGGVHASFTVDSESHITATVPPHAPSGTVTVTTPAGSGTSPFKFLVAPLIASLSRTSGRAGDVVTLYGTTLQTVNKVEFGNDYDGPTLIRSKSYGQLTVAVPPTALTGPISVYAPGTGGTSEDVFSVLPAVTSFSPGSATAGKPVTIHGSGFEDVADVSFGGVSATIVSAKLNTIVALVPDTAPLGRIVVTNAVGTGSSSSSFRPLPALVSADPAPAVAGGVVTLTGTNLGEATSLRLGSRTLPVVVDSPTQVHTTLPANAVGGPLTITTPAGTSAALSLTVSRP